MLGITFDGSTLRAFTFLSAVHDTISNGSSDPPLLSQPSLSTLSTSPSPFEPERPGDTPLKSSTATAGFTAPPIAYHSQNMQCACTDMFSPTAQISSFNAPDFNPGEPLTLAVRCRSASIFSLLLSLANHSVVVNILTCLTGAASTSTTCSTPTHMHTQFDSQSLSDDQNVVTKTTLNSLRMRSSFSDTNPARRRTRQRQLVVQGLGL
ncbi:uncharacterized protein FOMMEDRAFT_150475 [Fomitiporia mediterranea MF3/22]|uniref:uncharacterized protein n=1 Tax=Fomitiporia mediterranea (strain MF3/22) TaxID=694068 RepID=UPI00044093BF|nr:uncharacterized protein FOMMEDRAFT_150475 [Fomitiporia mediterranea MF3/22]EJD07886.1 hypothetical protein FOMMEDRAFT_150475 [Fomitiporia mediterranea MF3/22]